MNTAIVVYHAPQMKNWRNIITDSLVRITALLCRYCELLREPDDDVRARRENDIGVLGRVRHTRARDAARDAADDGALLVAAQHATQHCTGDRAGSYFGGVTRRDTPPFGRRLDRVDSRLDRVRGPTYCDVRNAQRQGPRRAGVGGGVYRPHGTQDRGDRPKYPPAGPH